MDDGKDAVITNLTPFNQAEAWSWTEGNATSHPIGAVPSTDTLAHIRRNIVVHNL